MHDSVISVSFLPIAIKFIARKHSPMLLVPVSFGLQKALTLVELLLKGLRLLTKSLHDRVVVLDVGRVIFLIEILWGFCWPGAHVNHGHIHILHWNSHHWLPVIVGAVFVPWLLSVSKPNSNSECLLRVDRWKISLKFLHIFLVANVDRLFTLFISPKLISPIQLMGRVRWVDTFTTKEISLVQRQALYISHDIIKVVTIHGLASRSLWNDTCFIWLSSRTYLVG